MTNVLKKISVGDVYGKIVIPDTPLKIIFLCGIVTDTKVKNTITGDVTGFYGNFEAFNYKNNEVYLSSLCFVPEPEMNFILSSFNKMGSIEFACDIYVSPNKNLSSYSFVYEHYIEPRVVDSLANLRLNNFNKIIETEKKAKK